MSDERHIELYKKYRPNTWKGLIGQQKVAKTLASAVVHHTLPTAYLFSGPRGCGKTSAALILAKAVNCLQPKDNGDPCNVCEVCKSIDNNSQIGVTYISAAQKSGVDDIRELVAQARLNVPIKRQVFIIDEIHNLKRGSGFEALLIPLEEKNMPALFIFCTTEIEKVPQTILSRVQSRRFSLLPGDLMLKYLQKIAKRENIDNEDILKEAVKQGRGSVRDTLSILEGLVAEGDALTESYDGKLLEALSNRELSEPYAIISKAANEGERMQTLTEELFEDVRNLLLFASDVEPDLIGPIPVHNETEVIKGFHGVKGLQMILNELGEVIKRITFGGDERINLEIGISKILVQMKKIDKYIAAKKQK